MQTPIFQLYSISMKKEINTNKKGIGDIMTKFKDYYETAQFNEFKNFIKKNYKMNLYYKFL